MIVSTIVSAVAFVTVVITTIVIIYKQRSYTETNQSRLRDVVDQVNTSQQYGYEFDKKQQQELAGLQKNVDDVRATYLTKKEASQVLDTQRLSATNANVGSLQVQDRTQYNSSVKGASASPDYIIQRGDTDPTKNHLVVKTPADTGAGINFMTTGGVSRMFIDSKTGAVNVPQYVQTRGLVIGAQSNYIVPFEGTTSGLYTGSPFGAEGLYSGSNLDVIGMANVYGSASISDKLELGGGQSAFNPGHNKTVFNDAKGKNTIAGDTSLLGSFDTAGNMTVDGETIVGKLNVTGPASFGNRVRVNKFDNLTGWDASAAAYIYAKPGEVGATLGSDLPSYFPGPDGHTYIRPGAEGKNIVIGDKGAANVMIGKGDTKVSVRGTLTTSGAINVANTDKDTISLGMSTTQRGISSQGGDVNIYTNGVNRFSVTQAGPIINQGPVIAPSVGRAANDNNLFKINELNAQNNNSPGTAMYQGVSVQGGGLSVGTVQKLPEGRAYIQKSLQIGSWPSTLPQPPLSANAVAGQPGASFGGTKYWSHLPWSDGNVYIRPGDDNKDISIGDIATKNVYVGASNGTAVRVGANSWFPNTNGDVVIRANGMNKNIYIGDDANTQHVNIGKSSAGEVRINSTNAYFKRHVDSGDSSWDPKSGTVLFAGWNSDKTVIGQNRVGADTYIKTVVPKGGVANIGDLYVKGQACINTTCLNETELTKLKALVK